MKYALLFLALLALPAASAFSISASGWGPYATASTSTHWGTFHTAHTPHTITAFGSATGGPNIGFTMERPAYTAYHIQADPRQNHRTIEYGDWKLMTAHVHDPHRGYVGNVARLPNGQYAADIMLGHYTGALPTARYPYGSFQHSWGHQFNHHAWHAQQIGYGWHYPQSAFVGR
jgi:hypothetical protein